MITELERAYLAGLFDGEGCLSIVEDTSKKKITPTPVLTLVAVVSSCDKFILDYWKNKTGIGSVNLSKKASGNARDGFAWVVSGKSAVDLINLMYPYLLIKKDEADIAYRFQETKGLNFCGRRVSPEIMEIRFQYRNELTRIKHHPTKRGRPRIDRPALEMAALLEGE